RWRVVGSGGGIWTSRDEGASWIRSDSLTPLYLSSAAFIGDSGGIAIGNNGLILKEADRRESWRLIRSGMDHHVDGMAMLSPTSWLSFGSPGAILKTEDAGITWTGPVKRPDTTRFLAGSFQGRRGLLTGYDGTIAISGDGGNSWEEVATPRKGLRMFGVAWSDSMTAVAVGDSAAIWRTSDAGRTWIERPHPPGIDTQTLSAVSFRPDGVGFIVGYDGAILRSADQGASWTVVPTPIVDPLYAFSFRDASVGLAVGGHGAVLATKDGGATWTRHSLETEDDYIFGVAWLHGDTAVGVGDYGHGWFLTLTVDGGATWKDLPLPTRKRLWAMTSLGSGRVAITGQDGAILIGTLASGNIETGPSSASPAEGSFSVQRTGAPGQVLMQMNLATEQKITISAYATDGRFLGTQYQGTLAAGGHSLRLRFARRGPTLFRMEGVGAQARISRTKLLPF
ncbi:MAG: YCF48-related protein, partial [Fibrobacteria bacterium]